MLHLRNSLSYINPLNKADSLIKQSATDRRSCRRPQRVSREWVLMNMELGWIRKGALSGKKGALTIELRLQLLQLETTKL